MRRSIFGGVLLAGTALLATACASSTTSSTPPAGSASSAPAQPTAAQSSAAESSAPPAAPSSSGGGIASPRGGGQSTCTTSGLGVKIGGSEGAAGSVYVTIDFTNTSGAACTLYGYPGVSLTGGTPAAQIGAAADRDHTKTPMPVPLAPGATATAVVQVVQAGNYDPSVCDPKPASALLVYPPDQTASVSLPYHGTGCASAGTVILHVSPVTAG